MAATQPELVQFPFGIDFTQIQKGFEALQATTKETLALATNAQAGLQNAFSQTARAEQQVTVAATEATKAIQNTTNATQLQTGVVGRLQQQVEGYKKAISSTTNTSDISRYNKLLEDTNTKLKMVSSAGKSGFDETGKAIAANSAGLQKLQGAYGLVAKAANIIPGLGISGAFLLIFEATVQLTQSLGILGETEEQTALRSQRLADAQKELNTQFKESVQLADDATKIISDASALRILELKKGGATNVQVRNEEIRLINEEIKQQDFLIASNGELANSAEAAKKRLFEAKGGFVKLSDDEKQELNKTIETYDKAFNTRVNLFQGLQRRQLENEITTQKEITDAQKKAEDTRKRNAEKAQRDREDAARTYQNLLAKLLNDEATLRAKSIPDNRAAEIAASDARFDQLKKDRKREIEQSKITEEQRKDLLKEFLNFEQDAVDAAAMARLNINAKYDAQELKLREAALKAIAELGGNQQEEEINKIKQAYIERAQVIKAGGELTAAVQKQLDENQARDEADVNIKFGTDRIKKQTELEIAGIKVAEKYQGEGAKVEKAKQIAILDAQLSGALAQLDLLEKSGKAKNTLEVEQAQETVNNIRQAIKNASKSDGKGFSLFQSLFGGLNEKDQANLKLAFSSTTDAFRTITDSIIAQYQRQIDAKQKLIDKDNELVNEAKDNLDRQLQLQKDGFANDVGAAQAALDQKQAQRDEDIRQQEELQKKQEEIQKAQRIAQEAAIIAQNVQTGVDLVGAIAKVFKAHAGIPFVGVALGVGFAALLASTFFSLKAAFTSGTPKRAKGGEIEGPSHAQGGTKHYFVDRDGRMRTEEWEGKEYLVNKHSYAKAPALVEAINNGSFFNMHPESLEDLLKGTGVRLPDDNPGQLVYQVQQRDEAIKQAAGSGSNATISQIASDVNFMANSKRNEVKRWEDEKWTYEKQGNKLIKVPKK